MGPTKTSDSGSESTVISMSFASRTAGTGAILGLLLNDDTEAAVWKKINEMEICLSERL